MRVCSYVRTGFGGAPHSTGLGEGDDITAATPSSTMMPPLKLGTTEKLISRRMYTAMGTAAHSITSRGNFALPTFIVPVSAPPELHTQTQ